MANGAGAALSIPREPRGLLQGMATATSFRSAAAQAHETVSSEAHAAHHVKQTVLGEHCFAQPPVDHTAGSRKAAVHVVIPPPRSWSAPPRCSSSCERRCFSPLRSASQGPDGRVQRQRRKHGSMELRLDLDGAHAAPLWLSRGWRRRWPCRGTAYTCTRETPTEHRMPYRIQ